jgi:hypothetical protein
VDESIAPQESRRDRIRRIRRHLFGEPAATAIFGAADIGPGRHGTPEQWARYREELRNPPPRRPSTPPPGYHFVSYVDGMGMRHRAAVRNTSDAPPGHDRPRS